MNSLRLKNVLILLFLSINIALAILLFADYTNAVKSYRQKMGWAAEILQQNNIMLPPEVIPPYSQGKVEVLIVENILKDSRDFAALILEEGFSGEGQSYQSGSKSLTINNLRFSYKDESQIYPGNDEADYVDVSQAINQARRMMEKININTKNVRFEFDGRYVLARQYYKGRPFFDSGLQILPGGTEVAQMEGMWNKVLDAKAQKAYVNDASVPLFEFLSNSAPYEMVGVTDIQLGYTVDFGASGVSYRMAEALPAYKIKFDSQSHIFDARMGTR